MGTGLEKREIVRFCLSAAAPHAHPLMTSKSCALWPVRLSIVSLGFAGPVLAQEGSSSPAQEPSQAEDPELPRVVLPGVIVTGQPPGDEVPKVPLDSVGSRDVFTPDQIAETGARDVNDLLLHMPAISTRPYNGGESAAPSFSMRGLPDDGLTEYVHVLIDGVPASPMPYSWTAFSFFPLSPDRIYAVDFMRGAHSVRYAPDTVGGVLNFITEPVPEDGELEFRTTFGDFGYSSSMISGGVSSGRFGWRATYVDRRGDGYREDGGFEQQDMNLKFRNELESGGWWALSLSYMESDHQAPGGLTLAEFDQDRWANTRPKNRFEGSRGVADFVFHKDLSGDSWYEAFTYGSLTKRHLIAQRPHFPAPGDPLTLSDWKDDSYFFGIGARGQHSYEALGMDHVLYGGLRYQREWIPNWTIESSPYDGGASTLTQDDEYSLDAYSVHLDDTFHPVDPLKITAGLRLEHIPSAKGENTVGANTYTFDESITELLPGIGASYSFGEDWALFGNFHRGLRAPQAWGFGLTPDPANAEVDFELADTSEVGLRYDNEESFSASVNLWRNSYDDFFVFDSGFYENLGAIEAVGVDLEGAVNLPVVEGLALLGSVTFQDSELQSGSFSGNQVPYAWKSKAAWRLRYANLGGWVATFGGTFVGESFSDDANTQLESADGRLGVNPSRTLWDAQVARTFDIGQEGMLRLAVGATNLFDHEWYVHSRGGFFGGGKVAGPPRQGYVSASYKVSF